MSLFSRALSVCVGLGTFSVDLDGMLRAPVTKSFAGDGGSNNMHLGWGGSSPALPGAWEPVPLSALATPR